jgi:antitoxin (DNA-binding transcriptional repressor) of toxin-antitoxin stability system
MKTLELVDATGSLRDYARKLGHKPVVLTQNGKPVAALVSIDNVDKETVSLSMNPQFMALIERSRARYNSEGGISSEDLRRQLGSTPAKRKRKGTKPKA